MKQVVFLGMLLLVLCRVNAERRGPWELSELFKTPQWDETEMASKDGVKGILYESIPYKGNRVHVFAYYGVPEGKVPEEGWPAVVCVHGGGGTAFDEWVKLWNSHGYAAISMDLEGHYPLRENEADRKSPRVETENPGPVRVGTFNDFAEPLEEQWYYHAVPQVILAHSLLRSLPEVNSEKTGITGISWGGVLTSTVIGLDDRFQFAIPVYGCGYIPGSDGYQGSLIEPGKHSEFVSKNYDGSAYFQNVKIPTFWVNGTNDRHYPMPSTQRSARSVCGPVSLRYKLGMRHGHGEGWAPDEIYAFADSIVKGGDSLVKFARPEIVDGQARVRIDASTEVEDVRVLYTVEKGLWPKRKWLELPASKSGNELSSAVPEGTVALFFTATDERGLMTSSEFLLVE